VRRGETSDAVAQYQQQLQKPSGPAARADALYDTSVAPVLEFADAAAVGGTAVRALSDESAGLTSLDVDVPARGVPFFFTTPRGEVTITVRSVSQQFIETLCRIGLALAVIAIGILGYVAWLRWHAWITPEALSMMAIVLGFAGIIIGILPILALVMLVAGVVARIGFRRRDRAVASA